MNPVEFLNVTDERIENIKSEIKKDTSLIMLQEVIKTGWPKHIRNVSDELKSYFKFQHDLTVHDGLQE